MEQYVAVFAEPIAAVVAAEVNDNPVVSSTYTLSNYGLVIRSHAAKPKVISDLIGFLGDQEHPRIGVVFKLNGSYNGYYMSTLWDWLSENRE